MFGLRIKYLSFFCGLISILSFFNVIYSYYFNFYLNLNTYYISFITSIIIAILFYNLDIIHPHNIPFLSFNLLHLLYSFTISSDRPQNFISPITPALLTPVQESQRWRKVKSSCQTSHPKSYSGKKNQIENESKPILPNLPP